MLRYNDFQNISRLTVCYQQFERAIACKNWVLCAELLDTWRALLKPIAQHKYPLDPSIEDLIFNQYLHITHLIDEALYATESAICNVHKIRAYF